MKDLLCGEVFVVVYDSKEDVDNQMQCGCFWINISDLKTFIKICKQNNKYIEIGLNFLEDNK